MAGEGLTRRRGKKGRQTEELLLLFSMLTPGTQAPCLQMFTYLTPPRPRRRHAVYL